MQSQQRGSRTGCAPGSERARVKELDDQVGRRSTSGIARRREEVHERKVEDGPHDQGREDEVKLVEAPVRARRHIADDCRAHADDLHPDNDLSYADVSDVSYAMLARPRRRSAPRL